MRSDAMREHGCALVRARRKGGALLLAAGMCGCAPGEAGPQSKLQGDPRAGTHSSVEAGRATGIATGGTGTVTENGTGMIVPTLPSGSAVAPLGGAGPGAQSGGAGALAMTTPAAVGGAGAATSGSAGQVSAAVTYPQLDAAAIGAPMQIASGFSLAESPLWDPCQNRLLFADVSAAGGGVINALGMDGKVTPFMSGTSNTNGLAWDVDGSLLLAQMSGHLARRDRSGMVKEIDNGGLRLHTPDDLTVRSDGTIYLSDGNFCPAGALLGYNDALPVYTIKPGGGMWTNSGTVKGPNGIELSPDEKFLYVNGYGEGAIYRFDVMPDGTIVKPAKPLVTGLSDPDSMCLDAAGNLYVAVTTGIQVLRPDGTKVKLISIAGRLGACTKAGMTNCTFGGPDGKTLYVTSWTALYKIDNMPIPGLDWQIAQARAMCM